MSAVALAGVVILILFMVKSNSLENRFSKLAVEYYEGEAKTYGSEIVEHLGYYMVKLDDLKNHDVDISKFEEKSCDLIETYAKVTLNKDSKTGYDVDVHLACEK